MFDSKKDKKWQFLDDLQQRRPTLYFLADLLLNIVVIVILVFIVRTYLISPFQVFGPSMCDTLNKIDGVCQDQFGEYLIVNKAVYFPFFGHRYGTPQRGDIIVFHPPHNEEDFYIKRVIGLPGEKIKIQNGKVFVYNNENQNGWDELNEEYLNESNKNHTYSMNSQLVVSYEVPDNYYFVLGDNRRKSTDSRMCFQGPSDYGCNDQTDHFLPIENIEGKAAVVLWPFTKIRFLSNPVY